MNFPLPSILAFAAMSGFASATVVNIDFGTTAGFTGSAGYTDPVGSGAIWNTLTTVAGSGTAFNPAVLNDSSGAPSLVGFQVSAASLENENQTTGNGELKGINSLLMRDYLRIQSAAGNVRVEATGKITGLVVGGSYDLYFYGQGQNMAPDLGSNRGQNSLFTVGGVSKQTGWDKVLPNGDGNFTESLSFTQQGEYVKFSAIANSSGEIAFSWQNVVSTGISPNVAQDFAPSTSPTVGSAFAALNAIQIVAVPEPSSAILSALGVLGVLLRRRR